MHRFTRLVASLLALSPSIAAAQAGVFFHAGDAASVAEQRILVSLSATQTTVWTQIELDGATGDVALVVPVQGVVELGMSSDALFENLAAETAVTVVPPFTCVACDGPSDAGFAELEGGVGIDPVAARETATPSETVQLSSSDPTALASWLAGHGFVVPPAVEPVIDAYVAEGYDFLALVFRTTSAVQRTRPLRITAPGADASLATRMSIAGATTQTTMWVVSDGRRDVTNETTFVIDPETVTWSFDTDTSDYHARVVEGFATGDWLVEVARPASGEALASRLEALLARSESGYGDATGTGALDELTADRERLFAPLEEAWVTRLRAVRAADAWDVDAVLGGGAGDVDGLVVAGTSTGSAPMCDGACDAGTSIDAGDVDVDAATSDAGARDAGDAPTSSSGCGCNVPRRSTSGAEALVMAMAIGMVLLSRRRTASRG